MRRAFSVRGKQRAFTLLEVVFAMIITLIMGLSAVASIVYTRQSMELEKQRLAALNFCRQLTEAAQTNASVDAGTKLLVPFNSPGLEIRAEATVAFYRLTSNGGIDWNNPLDGPLNAETVACHASVTWRPSGSWSRLQSVEILTLVVAGLT